MEIDYKAIGQRIKIARIKKGITQEAVADLIDITPAHMSKDVYKRQDWNRLRFISVSADCSKKSGFYTSLRERKIG